MFKRWFCLALALAVCLGPFAFAEDFAAANEAALPDASGEGLEIEALPEEIEIDPQAALALDVEDVPVLDELQPIDIELTLPGESQDTAEEAPAERTEAAGPTLTLSAESLVIGIKEKCTVLKATRLPEDDGDAVTWSSSRTSVARVDSQTGKITGVKKGTATITARTDSGLEASCVVKVKNAPGSVSLKADAMTLSVGETGALKAVLPSGTGSTLTHTSGNKKVATVDKRTGVVTAVAPGTATITVKTFNKKSATCQVTVVAAPNEVFLPGTLTLALNGKTTVEASAADIDGAPVPATFTYSAKKGTGRIGINAKTGKIVGKAVGTATLYVVAHNGVSTHLSDGQRVETVCQVNVVEAASAVALAAESVTIGLSQSYDLSPRVLAADGSVMLGAGYTVQSSDPIGLGVSSDGVVVGLKKGSYAVTVSYGAQVQATCAVEVVGAPARVTLSPEEVSLDVGASAQLSVTLPEGTMASCDFSSSDEAVAKVDESGNVTAVGPGAAVITVMTHNSKRDTCAVTVYGPATGLVVTPDSVEAELKTGGVQLEWRFASEYERAAVHFESADTGVATVGEDGYVAFVSVGRTQVTASTDGGLTATVEVSVLEDEKDQTAYRLFAAYSYYDSLPFVKRNANAMAKVFGNSSIDGQTYATKVLGNPGKSKLLSGISAFFDDTDENDVSIVYLCSHGHNDKSSYSGYRLSLKGYDNHKNDARYYLTAAEIFDSVRAIQGRVILILDSCYSGTFINDMKSRLKKEDGRIAVLAAASNTRATYYTKKSKSVDFFTFFLLQGLGYNEKEGWWNRNSDGEKGSFPGYFAADQKGNKDGAATLAEFYSFAEKCIDVNIPNYMKKSWYWGDPDKVQKTRFFAGSLKKLVIYRPKA